MRIVARVDAPWLSVLPPLIAIGLSLLTRKVIVALGVAVMLGALLVERLSPVASLERLGIYGFHAVSAPSHLGILTFSLLLGGLMGMMQHSGEQERLAKLAVRFATTRVRGQLATWFLGLLIFFDDYVNTLVVGSSMRPIYDRLRISREKLAFLVDATSAPVVSLALVSSWIAVEIGYINEQYAALGLTTDGLLVFIQTLPYRFYPWLMLTFGLSVAYFGRDFGPMLAAERGAAQIVETCPVSSTALPKTSLENAPAPDFRKRDGSRQLLSALPLLSLFLVALGGMWLDGYLLVSAEGIEPEMRQVVGRSRSHVVLVVAALVGNVVSVLIAVFGRKSSLRALANDAGGGARRMLLPCGILISAWSLSNVCRDLETADYLVGLLRDGLTPGLLPAAVFLIAALTSFATGTSWGTMAILFPIVVPLAHGLSAGNEAILLGSVSSILAGSVWGDHCSPISDTTIMSSLASGCDHISHVKTQLPYALVVGAVSITVGDLLTGVGLLAPGAALALGALILACIVRFYGTQIHPPPNQT